MADVTPLNTQTKLDLPAAKILDGAKAYDLQECIVVGADKAGMLHVFSTTAQLGQAHWLLSVAAADMLKRAGSRPLEPLPNEAPESDPPPHKLFTP